jgi:hypothetical protein
MTTTKSKPRRSGRPAQDQFAAKLPDDLKVVDRAIREAVRDPRVRARLAKLLRPKARAK